MSARDEQLELEELRRDNARLREDVLRMRGSLSWRVTEPLRRVANAARRSGLRSLLARDEAPRPPPVATEVLPRRFDEVVVIFALLPFAQAGGGQRSAQLARAWARRGHAVRYVYAADSFNFARGAVEDLPAPPELALHRHVADVSPRELLAGLPRGSTFVFEAPHPRFTRFFEAARRAGVRTVFELIDDWETSLGADWFDQALMKRFVAGSEVVTGTARSLQAELAQRFGRPDARYLPNAADERFFRPRALPRPTEYEPGLRALVYVGTLSGEWLSWEHLAAAGRVPGARVYLIGDLPHDRRLPPGVVSLGPRDVSDVPRYLAHADCALIPFVPGKLSDAVSPIKVFEYLFMQRPVVATPLPELRGLPGVSLAETPEAFAAACQRPAVASAEALDRFFVGNGWSARAEQLLELPTLPPLTWLVLDRGTPRDLARCVASLDRHGGPGGHRPTVVGADVAEALRAAPADGWVALLDSRAALLAPTPVAQAARRFAQEAGALALAAAGVDTASSLVFLRGAALTALTVAAAGPETTLSAGPEDLVLSAELGALDSPPEACSLRLVAGP